MPGTASRRTLVNGCWGAASTSSVAADLDDLAEVHDGDDVADVAHDGDVVADEQHREAERGADVTDHVEDRSLHRHVERRGDLVGDQQPRIGRQRPGDGDPLQLPSGQLPREHRPDGRVEGDEVEQPRRLGAALGPAQPAADGQCLHHRFADGHPRVERRVRVLEHHLDAPPPVAGGAIPAGDVLAVQRDRSAGERRQSDDGPGQRRLAGARLADKSDDAARRARRG